jgi:hypothetical protein
LVKNGDSFDVFGVLPVVKVLLRRVRDHAMGSVDDWICDNSDEAQSLFAREFEGFWAKF